MDKMSFSVNFIPVPVKFLIIVISCYICFGSKEALDGDFVFDDNVAIKKNKDLDVKANLTDIFIHDFWGAKLDKLSHKSYRPLTILTFKIENYIYGLNPFYMKIVNLVLHSICSCLVYLMCSIIFCGGSDHTPVSFMTSLMFAVHPVHTEVVSGIVGRTELLSGIIFLICLILYWKKRESLLYLTSVVGFLSLIGLLCKESAIMILPTCVTLDLLKNQNVFNLLRKLRFKNLIKRNIKNMTLILTTFILLYFRFYIINFEAPNFKPADNPLAASNNTLTRVLTQNYLYALNFWLLLCPDWLCFDWAIGTIPLIETWIDVRILAIAIFWLCIIGILIVGTRNDIAAICLMILTFLPASGLIKVGFVIAERVLYIPSIGFCILISLGMQKLMKKNPKMENIVKLAFVSIIVIMMARSYMRSLDWKNEETLFNADLKICGNNAKIHYNVARVAAEKQQKDIAFKHYKIAIDLYPDYESALMNLGNLYRESNDLEMAEYYLKRSVTVADDFASAWMNLGIVQAAMKNYNDALYSYKKALQHRKNYANCYYNMGNLYIDMKNSSMAMKYWKETLAIDPMHGRAWSNILAYFDNKGLAEEILKYSEAALKYVPNDASILFSRANAFGKLGNFNESESLFLRAIQLKPTSAVFHANLGVLYHRFNKRDKALESYRNALKLEPNLKSAKQNMQKLLNS